MSRIDKALSSLKSNSEVDVDKASVELDDGQQPLDCISTGSIVVDYLIGGYETESGEKRCPGIPRGRISEIFGKEGTGKTTLAIQTAIQCQQQGGSVAFLDFEHAFAPTYAVDLGLSVEADSFRLFQPHHWEEGAEIIKAMAEAGVDLIIVDSVAAMKPKVAIEDKNVSDSGKIGHIASLMSSFLPKITKDLGENNSALMYLNQLRSRIKTSRYDTGPDEETSGGRALKYFSSLRLKLKRVKTEYAKVESDLTGDEEKQPVSNIIRAKNIKNKVSRHQGHSAEFVIRYGEGIDNVRSVIDIASARDVIEQAGPWYSFIDLEGEEVKVQGKEALRKHFLENPDDFQAVVKKVSSFSKGKPDKIEDVSDEDIEVEEEGEEE